MKLNINERMRIAVANSGKTKAQVAREVGVAVTQLYTWIHGTCVPRIDRIVKLADVCGVTLDYLARDEETEDTDQEREA